MFCGIYYILFHACGRRYCLTTYYFYKLGATQSWTWVGFIRGLWVELGWVKVQGWTVTVARSQLSSHKLDSFELLKWGINAGLLWVVIIYSILCMDKVFLHLRCFCLCFPQTYCHSWARVQPRLEMIPYFVVDGAHTTAVKRNKIILFQFKRIFRQVSQLKQGLADRTAKTAVSVAI